MKSRDIGILISGVMGVSLLSLAPATAAILVEPIVITPNPDYIDGVEIPFGLAPGQLTFWSAPDTSGEQNFLNSTGLDINQFSVIVLPELDLLTDDDITWGDVNGDGKIGFSNIFSSITVNQDFTFQFVSVPQVFRAPRINLFDGTIKSGDRFSIRFITEPNLRPEIPGDNGPLLVGGVYFGSVPVPEPSTLIGFTLVTLAGGCLGKYKSTRKKLKH